MGGVRSGRFARIGKERAKRSSVGFGEREKISIDDLTIWMLYQECFAERILSVGVRLQKKAGKDVLADYFATTQHLILYLNAEVAGGIEVKGLSGAQVTGAVGGIRSQLPFIACKQFRPMMLL